MSDTPSIVMESRIKRRRTTQQPYIESPNTRSNHDDRPRPRTSSNLCLDSQETLKSRPPVSNSAKDYRINSGLYEQSIDDELDQVIVAVDMRESGTVGCSYYSAQEEKLYLLGDLRYSSTEIIDSCSSEPLCSHAQKLTRSKWSSRLSLQCS